MSVAGHHLLQTKQAAELQSMMFWKTPFRSALTRQDLIEYVVLDVEFQQSWNPQERQRGGPGRHSGRDAWCLADVTVAKRVDFGSNDRQTTVRSHLGHLLKVPT